MCGGQYMALPPLLVRAGQGSQPEGMCIVWRMDCNSLLIAGWGQLLVLSLLLDLFPLHVHTDVM